jgi:glycosyltransferase involved in cell wall biosynthesis
MRIITLATSATLPHAAVLARSLARHQPGSPHEIVLLGRGDDRSPDTIPASATVSSAAEVLGRDVAPLIARHDPEDLSTLLVPLLLRRVAARGEGAVLHLPATSVVLADLGPFERALALRDVLLLPRLWQELPEDQLEPSSEALDRAGRIDDAVMAVRDTEEADAFLGWWADRVEWALGSPDGRRRPVRPEDRSWLARFLELAPARFGTAVLDDPGCNASMWNLHEWTLAAGPAGPLIEGQGPLRVLGLAGFDPEHPHRLSPKATRIRVSRSPVLRELLVEYDEQLRNAGWRDETRRADVGRRLPDGLAYDDAMRRLYARALALGERFDDIFSEQGAQAFTGWLGGPAPWGGAHGINRYVFYRVAVERPDVVRAYPDLDGAGGSEYVDWCWTFGREELSIPDRFMPPGRGGHRPLARRTSRAPGGRPAAGARGARAAGARRVGRARQAANGTRPAAVRVSGYLNNTLGLGAAARGYVRALGAAGVQVSTISVPLHHLSLPEDLAAGYGREAFDELSHAGDHAFELVAVNADELPSFVERLGDDFLEGLRIGIWGWETSSIPARWERAFTLVDEIWVYSSFMAANIASVAPVPVTVLPPPVEAPAALGPPLRLEVPEGFLFLFIFDYLSTIQRKNPVGLIEAFRRAFAPGEGPQLLIKTINAPLRPLDDEEVLWAAHGREDIHVVDRSLSNEEMGRLMATCDCYVSLHRAEGFGLTLAEAMAIGKPVIATGYSGNLDFMTAENSYLVDYTVVRVGPDCEIYPPDGEWADPDIDQAAAFMRAVLEVPEGAAARGRLAEARVLRDLSPAATGERMRARLLELSLMPVAGGESDTDGTAGMGAGLRSHA